MAVTEQESIENIKTYLKVRTPTIIDKYYYSISNDNHTFTLFDPVRKCESNKSVHFEIDKIFTEKEGNKEIYEEICKDCVNQSLRGQSFTFISYGDTASDKYYTHFGGKDCYSNPNNRGLYPRFSEELLGAVKAHQSLQDNPSMSISLSFFMFNGVKLIDLSQYYNKDVSSLNEAAIIASGFKIKPNADNLENIAKLSVDNVNQVILFLDNIFKCFESLDQESCHLLTLSHFCFVLYIIDDKGATISTITFILLAGSENLPTKVTNPNLPSKDLINNTKSTVDKQATFVSIINSIANLKTMQKLEKSEETKMSIVLSSLCFNPFTKMEFRVIGNILPNTGMYSIIQDTLLFLFKCKKIVRIRPDVEKVSFELKQEVKKEDIVYTLENKLKLQQKTIQDLDERLNLKQKRINFLESNYKTQTEAIKEKFSFVGDTNILLSGNEYTDEGKLARKIRDAVDNSRIKSNRIEELEQKVASLQKENRLLTETYSKKNKDQKMIAFYNTMKEDNENRESKMKSTHMQSDLFDSLKKRNAELQEMLHEYKEELHIKADILINLPQVLLKKEEEENNKTKVKEDTKRRMENKYKKEIKTVQEENNKKMDVIKQNHSNLMTQKEKEISDIRYQYEQLRAIASEETNSLQNELVTLSDLIEHLISVYRLSFDKIKNGINVNSTANFDHFMKLKEEFEKNMEMVQLSLNKYQFPLLYTNYLSTNNNQKKQTNLQFKSQKVTKDNEVNVNANKNNDKDKETFSYEYLVPKSNGEIEALSKDELEDYIKAIIDQVEEVKAFSEKYIQYKKGYHVKEFKYTHEYIQQLQANIQQLKQQCNDQVNITNNNAIMLKSQKRTHEKIAAQNDLFKTRLVVPVPNISQTANMFYQRNKRVDTEPSSTTSKKRSQRQSSGKLEKKRADAISMSTSRDMRNVHSVTTNNYFSSSNKNNNI